MKMSYIILVKLKTILACSDIELTNPLKKIIVHDFMTLQHMKESEGNPKST